MLRRGGIVALTYFGKVTYQKVGTLIRGGSRTISVDMPGVATSPLRTGGSMFDTSQT